MENCKEKLNYLLDLKKTKKEPNKIERDQFSCAWENLVVEEDYSDDAEYYLYNGFTYCERHRCIDSSVIVKIH